MSDDARKRQERWQEVERIYCLAIELEGPARSALLDDACGGDTDLRRSIESLLACEPDAAGFLEATALDVAADLLTHGEDADLVGRHVGPYLIEAWIGSGGMGDVYCARDANLHRRVALKILPGLFAADPVRLARFKHEAQVLAALNHPNIAAIHGFEESDGVQAIVLELVEGPTLADRLGHGPMPIAEALPIARQIAEGLEAAHEQGIVHRDLKPANIVVRQDGMVKVLDFGLASALQAPAGAGREVTEAPVNVNPSTAGTLFGTAAYCSPEQASGRQVDRRADVWAFGAVLYEMLTGRRAFKGDGTPEILAAVQAQDVEWDALPRATPESVRRLLARCLERDAKRRLRDIGEARIVLEEPLADDVGQTGNKASHAPPWWRRANAVVPAAVAIAGLAAALAWFVKPSPPLTVTRFPLALPEGQVFSRGIGRHSIAISPDGAQIVYSGVPAGLYLRPLGALAATVIQGTEGYARVTEPVFSPDGHSVAFYTDQSIKRIAVTGGSAVTLADTGVPYGINWGRDGIVFGEGRDGILRVPANGGTPEVLVRVKGDEEAHGPQLLPDGQHVLFTLATGTSNDRWNKAQIVVQSLASGKRTTLVEGGSDARYLTTGHLVYALSGILYAVAFDVRRLEVKGPAAAMIEGVSRATGNQTGAAHFGVSDTGSLIYIPGPAVATAGLGETMQLALIDRSGNIEPLQLPPGAYQTPRVSPDGSRIVFGTDDGTEAVVWIHDLSSAAPRRRLTFGGNNRFPIWSRDGTRVAFQSDREGDRAIFSQPADGSGTAERLTTPDAGTAHTPESWSRKEDRFLFSVEKGSSASLWMFSLRTGKAEPFGGVQSSTPIGAVFSPDDRWIAYGSAERGTQTIYVQPFPATGAKYQLVAKGADTPAHPVWSSDGRELFYNPRPRGLEVVRVTTVPTFAFGMSTAVPRPFQLTPPEQRRAYDITPRGKFVARIAPPGSASNASADAQFQVILNWNEELRVRVPGAQ